MVFDCFMFFNEVELTELRFEYLDPYVDYFVVLESDLTHSAQPKAKHFLLNDLSWERWQDKIIYADVDLNGYHSAWERQGQQRNAVQRVLKDMEAKDSDLILMSDGDEIPNCVPIELNWEGSFKQEMYCYYLNMLVPYPWHGTYALGYDRFKACVPEHLRAMVHAGTMVNDASIDNGGWHFSSLGGTERVAAKLRSYTHQEYNTPEVHASLEQKIRDGEDLFGRNEFYEVVPVPDVAKNLAVRYPNLVV